MLTGCNSVWMPRIGSSSSSRNGAGPCLRRMPRARSSRSRAPRPGWRARCSARWSSRTRGSSGRARTSRSPAPRRRIFRSRRRPSSSSTSRRPGSRPAPPRSARSAPCGSAGSRRPGRSRRSSAHAAPLGPAITQLTGIRDADLRGAPADRRRHAPLPRVRRRLRARRAQRPLRHVVPRPCRRPDGVAPAGRAGARHGSARPSASRTGGPGARASPRSRGSSGRRSQPCHRALADARGDGRDPRGPDRNGAGARRGHGGRSPADRGTAGAAGPRQALARVRRAHAARRLPLPRRRRPGALRRPRAEPADAASLVLRHRAPAPGRRGGARRARADRVARPRLGGRGGDRGAAAHPRAASARERSRAAPRPLRLPRARATTGSGSRRRRPRSAR